MPGTTVTISKIAGAIGAEIGGVDLRGELSDETIAGIRRAWLDHVVIFFRDQEIANAQFLAFAERFGNPVEYPFIRGLDGFPTITPVIKLEHERINFGACGIQTPLTWIRRRWLHS